MTYIIALDLDGVVYHFERTARYMLRRKLQEEGRPENVRLLGESQSWSDIEDMVDPADWDWVWRVAVKDGLFRYGHVVGGAIEGAQALAELGDVIIVTSRPKYAVKDTNAWLGLMFDRVDYAGIRILSHGEKKSDVTPKPNLFIDDGPHNILDVRDNTASHVRALLFDQPWNQEFPMDLTGKVQRAFGWTDTVEKARAAKEGKW